MFRGNVAVGSPGPKNGGTFTPCASLAMPPGGPIQTSPPDRSVPTTKTVHEDWMDNLRSDFLLFGEAMYQLAGEENVDTYLYIGRRSIPSGRELRSGF